MGDREDLERIAREILASLVYSVGDRIDAEYETLTDAERNTVYSLVVSRFDI